MITVHVLIKNEANFVWYAVMSVIRYVDKVLLWDTGSTDGTIEIIKEILKTREGSTKVYFKSRTGDFDEERVRQEMLDETRDGWFLVIDGDEIWWNESIEKLTNFIKEHGHNYESVVTPTINLVGDIFHFQEKEAGKYNLAGRKGHYALRAINTKIPGLHSYGEHGVWGWVDGENKMIQDRDKNRMKFIDAKYLHATHLQRAGNVLGSNEVVKRAFKLKHELGISFPKDFYYPEVFFRPRPIGIPNIWENMTFGFKVRSFFETPLRKINRRVMPERVGY